MKEEMGEEKEEEVKVKVKGDCNCVCDWTERCERGREKRSRRGDGVPWSVDTSQWLLLVPLRTSSAPALTRPKLGTCAQRFLSEGSRELQLIRESHAMT